MSEDWDLEIETGVSQLNITENANFLRQEEPVAFGKSFSNGGAADYNQSFRSNRGYGRGRRGGMRNDQRTYESYGKDTNWRSQNGDQENAGMSNGNREDSMKIMVLNTNIGKVIGKGGQTIRELQDSTGAIIKIRKDQCEFISTPVEIIGSKEAQIAAKEKIEDLTDDITTRRMKETARDSSKGKTDAFGRPQIDWKALAENREANEKIRWEGLGDVIKEFYDELPEIRDMNPVDVAEIRKEKNSITVQHMSDDKEILKIPIKNPVLTFENAFHNYPEILDTIYNQNFTTPSPIQCQAWPVLLSGNDVIGVAQTGTGKTLAFLLPALIHIDQQPTPRAKREGPSCLVLSPTRELAQQIEVEVKKFNYKGIRSVCIYGGGDRREQIGIVERGVEIVIGTPGRLNDLLMNGILSVKHVLDEADRMLDMGFEPEIKKIILDIRPDRQTVMTSATWPQGVQRMADQYLNNPIKVNVGSLDLQACHSVTQLIERVESADKKERIIQFINDMDPEDKLLIFAGKKVTVDDISSDLVLRGVHVGIQTIHGDREQSDREQALEDFRTGEARVLIATDVASRGLDIKDITHVVNYDFPRHIEEYVHRIGRTGRAGRSGTALTFVAREDWSSAHKLIDIMTEADQEIPDWLVDMAERYKAYRERTRGEGVSNVSGNACFKCGEEGHFSRECRNPSTNNSAGGQSRDSRPRGSCYSCGESGHMSRDCPKGATMRGLGRDFGRIRKDDDKGRQRPGRGRGRRTRDDDDFGFMF
eukprot:gene7439-13201_t